MCVSRHNVGEVTEKDCFYLTRKRPTIELGRKDGGTNMLSPFLAFLLSVLILCRIAVSQYSSDQCSWRGRWVSAYIYLYHSSLLHGLLRPFLTIGTDSRFVNLLCDMHTGQAKSACVNMNRITRSSLFFEEKVIFAPWFIWTSMTPPCSVVLPSDKMHSRCHEWRLTLTLTLAQKETSWQINVSCLWIGSFETCKITVFILHLFYIACSSLYIHFLVKSYKWATCMVCVHVIIKCPVYGQLIVSLSRSGRRWIFDIRKFPLAELSCEIKMYLLLVVIYLFLGVAGNGKPICQEPQKELTLFSSTQVWSVMKLSEAVWFLPNCRSGSPQSIKFTRPLS